jgi:hypothetical protein
MAHQPARAATVIGVLAITLAPACKGPSVPHPMTGQVRYTCCNLYYERPEITDANYQRGTLIPLGTRVQILEVDGHEVKFQPDGHPPITLALKYGKDAVTMDSYLDRVFLAQDPHARLRTQPAKIRKLIEQGAVEEGMNREQVLMSLGYPPAHRTPSLDSPTWTYWANRFATFMVHFDGDRVARVQR